jgi:hypothetical protein
LLLPNKNKENKETKLKANDGNNLENNTKSKNISSKQLLLEVILR